MSLLSAVDRVDRAVVDDALRVDPDREVRVTDASERILSQLPQRGEIEVGHVVPPIQPTAEDDSRIRE